MGIKINKPTAVVLDSIMTTGEYPSYSVFLQACGYVPVVFSADCDEDGFCPQCGGEYHDCPCPGPTQEGMEYEEAAGVLYARPITN